MKASKNTIQDQAPTWSEVVRVERNLSDRLRHILLEFGIDHDTVEAWIEEHDTSELLLRPVTKQEARIKAMYAMEPSI